MPNYFWALVCNYKIFEKPLQINQSENLAFGKINELF